MFTYQKGNTVNVVKGSLPEENPYIQVGFEGTAADWDLTFIKVGGVNVPVKADGGTVEMLDQITLNGQTMTVSNPNLVTTVTAAGYDISGEMAVADPAVCKAWGYPEGSHLFTTRVVFDGDIDPETFSGTCDGVVKGKPISYDKFDGPNYIDYIFSGETKEIVIKYKANADAEEKTITITNNATMAGAEDAGEEEEVLEEPVEEEAVNEDVEVEEQA